MAEAIALGIDIGGTNVKVAFVTETGEVVAQGSVPTAPERGPEQFATAVAAYTKELAQAHQLAWADVIGAGVGIAGFLDLKQGMVEESVNLFWHNVPIVELMGKALGKTVRLDNDANVAALGEVWLGAGKEAQAEAALCVTLGTGVGGGIVIDGRIYRGVSTMAGEIGHIPVKYDGELCNCGHHGCLETLASATALARHAKAAGLTSPTGEELTAKDVFDLAIAGNKIAQNVVDEMIHWLAVGLATAANLLNPDFIVISGGVVNAGDALLTPLRKAFAKEALQRVADNCEIVAATLGSNAGVLGAARLVWQ